ncbi:hypothetical protein IW261DRAFT_1570822 [Armillaria novae-zelandiae]|uniref:Nephrocystin 3-like N-terminal domain-containing protein n=1 Tax=Armillaria novae-zelandiae TaxID=153914 RepID=A0AA39T8Z6_9AGAR|nr:hypothetical protein IW261DRAFT_1570822 [Armillaria novae-zelandiae]
MEAVGLASAIVSLVELAHITVKYLKDVKDAPKERDELSKQLSNLAIYLTATHPNGGGRRPLACYGAKIKLEPASDGMGRMKQRLFWKFSKESVEDTLKKIERIKSLVVIAVQHDHATLSHAINEMLTTVDTKVDDISDDTKRIRYDVGRVDRNTVKIGGQVTYMNNEMLRMQNQIQKFQDDEMLMRVAVWLSSTNFKSVQAEKLTQRVGDTERWFLECQQIQEWVHGPADSACLWCPGNPGVGKTILASITIDHLRMLVNQKETLVLSIFCDYQSTTTQTVVDILCSLMKQLIQDSGLSIPITSLYSQCLRDQTRPSLHDLTKILSQEFESLQRVYIVLDALDEFIDDNGGREELLGLIKSLGPNIHLLVTSRDITTIGSLFQEDTRLNIRATDEDINTYIAAKLSRGRFSRHVRGRDDLREAILAGIAGKAKGMFLLAGLHMDLLAQTTNPKILREVLSKLPESMTSAYDKTLARVDSQGVYDRDLVYRVYSWVAFAKRPLTVLELRYALAVEPGTKVLDPDNLFDGDFLGSVCAGLVITEPGFDQERGPVMRFELFPYIQETIMRTCLTYLSFDIFALPETFEDIRTRPEIFPFLRYSSSNWGFHASPSVQYSMEDEIVTFLDVEHHRRVTAKFTRIYGGSRPFAPSPLLFAAYYGLMHIMEVFMNRGADPRNDLPLGLAAQEGHLDMVKMLLARDDVDVNQTDPERRYRTPLMEAARNGHPEVVRAILKSERMDSLNKVCENGASALFWAVWGGHSGVVRILLAQPDIEATTWDENYESPLMVAAGRGHTDIVRMFLEREDINLDAPSFVTQQTALRYAADTGHDHIVEMLLKTGRVDVNSQDWHGFMALAGAAKEGKTQAVKVLLENPGVDTMATDYKARTAYDLAVENGHHGSQACLQHLRPKLRGTRMITLSRRSTLSL